MQESTIYKRCSVRRFTDQPVSDDQIKELLRAAMNAPSAHNRQPWRFLVIRDEGQRRFIAENISTASFTKYSPVCVFIIGNPYEANGDAFVQDCSAAMENLLLRAVEIGLGGCWIGVEHMPDRVDLLKKHFGISFPYYPFGIAAIGYPGREYEITDRYDEKKIFWETFDPEDMKRD